MNIRKSNASYTICNNLSIIIQEIQYGLEDKVLWHWGNENKLHKSKINYSRKGGYFLVNKTRFYLEDFCKMR